MKLIPEIPCKDCITFAVCNAQITNNYPYVDVVMHLIPKCSIIEKYARAHIFKNGCYSPTKVDQVVEFFKPKKHL